MSRLLTDEAVEAAAIRMHNAQIAEAEYAESWEAQSEPSRRYWRSKARALLVAHHEGERPCGLCEVGPPGPSGCPRCGGTGRVRDDNLVLERETRADERERVLREVIAALRERADAMQPPARASGVAKLEHLVRREGLHDDADYLERMAKEGRL